VFHSTQGTLSNGRTFTTRANTGSVPLVADAARDAEGVIVVRRGSKQGLEVTRVGSTSTSAAGTCGTGSCSSTAHRRYRSPTLVAPEIFSDDTAG
jgi:hypothetical protein